MFGKQVNPPDDRVLRPGAVWLLLAAAVAGVLCPCPAMAKAPAAGVVLRGPQQVEARPGGPRVTLPFAIQDVPATRAADGTGRFSGLPAGGYPGRPRLPVQTVRVLLPPDADLHRVSIALRNPTVRRLPGTWDIPAAPPYAASAGRPVWPADTRIAGGRDRGVYEQDAFYPAGHLGRVRVGQLRQWNLATIPVFPYRFNPVTRELDWLEGGELVFDCPPAAGGEAAAPAPRPGTAEGEALRRGLAAAAINFDSAVDAYAAGEPVAAAGAPGAEYVIITTSSILGQSARLGAFIAAKAGRGFSVAVVTEGAAEDEAHYLSGSSCDERADNIRNWLQNRYASLGIEYVLLVGNPHPAAFAGSSSIPMKLCWPRRGEGSDEQSPTDMYFAELTGDWDRDGDGYFGEYDDVSRPGGIDMLCEVQVGRIPVYDTGSTQIGHLDRILEKTAAYEASADRGWRSNYLGSAGFQDDGFTVDGAELIEQFRTNVCAPNGWSTMRLYQQGSVNTNCDSTHESEYELRGSAYGTDLNHHHYHWQQHDFGVVMWWGHGASTRTAVGAGAAQDGYLFYNTQAAALDDTHPSFLFPISCNNGYPETTDNLCVSVLRNGGVAALSPSRVTWFAVAAWQTSFFATYSDNASINYEAARRMVQDQEPIGDAMTWVHANGGLSAWEGSSLMNHLDFNLYGDPSVGLYTEPSLGAPTGVAASDGTHTGRVSIAWTGIDGASHYQVYRADAADGERTALGGWQTATSCDDLEAAPGVDYFYWVRAAVDEAGSYAGDFSAEDGGWRALAPPGDVAATDGAFADRVRVAWSGVLGATHYQVYRAEAAGGERTAWGGWQAETAFDDTAATAGVTYAYSVRAAVDDAGARASGYSLEDDGWRPVLYTITAGASGNGSITPEGPVPVAAGGTTNFVITADTNHHVAGIETNGAPIPDSPFTGNDLTRTNYTWSNIAADGTITAVFALNTYTLEASAGPHGSILPTGSIVVAHGTAAEVTATADPGYYIRSITVDGADTDSFGQGDTNYVHAFTNVTHDHAITALFETNAVAWHGADGYRAAETNIVRCAFTYPADRELISLAWMPALPTGWTLAATSGDGSPAVTSETAISLAGPFTNNPVAFSYAIIAPAGEAGAKDLAADIAYRLDGMAEPSAVRAAPDPLVLSQLHRLEILSDRGAAEPAAGTYVYTNGTVVTCLVSNSPVAAGAGARYVCTGAEVAGNAFTQVDPTNATLTLTNDATLAWQWAAEYRLETAAGPHGSVAPSGSWHRAGSEVAVTATPDTYFHFVQWTGTVASASNPVTVPMTQAQSLVGLFAENLATNATPEWWLAAYGWTNAFDAAAMADADGDGMAAWAEYVAGTSPADAASRFRAALDDGRTGADAVLRWTSASNRVYTILRTTNMLAGLDVLVSEVLATPPENVHTDAVAGAEIFYYQIRVERAGE